MKKEHKMRHFTNGKEVVYNNNSYIVDYVVIRGHDLFVRLYNYQHDVHEKFIHCDLTTFRLTREDTAGSEANNPVSDSILDK